MNPLVGSVNTSGGSTTEMVNRFCYLRLRGMLSVNGSADAAVMARIRCDDNTFRQ